MGTGKLTDVQRTAMQALEAARAAGVGLSAYARANGLNARQIHDSVSGLRKRGALPPTRKPRRARAKAAFVAVDVVRLGPAQPRGAMVCRLTHRSGLVIECGEWPPLALVSALLAEWRDVGKRSKIPVVDLRVSNISSEILPAQNHPTACFANRV